MAVIVPDPEFLLPWAKERSMGNNMVALCRDPNVKKAVMSSMMEQGREAKLRSFEQVSQEVVQHASLVSTRRAQGVTYVISMFQHALNSCDVNSQYQKLIFDDMEHVTSPRFSSPCPCRSLLLCFRDCPCGKVFANLPSHTKAEVSTLLPVK